MPIEILMPALSPTMTEGNLSKWVKKEGDKIAPGDVIAEIETDKATMEVESIERGILAKILIPANTPNVAVNQLIALIIEEGEDLSSIANYSSSLPISDSTPNSAIQENDKAVTIAHSLPQSKNERIFASPLAKRIAANESIDLNRITGTGPHGRIIKADVLSASKDTASKSSPKNNVVLGEEYTKIPHTMMRKVIAKRLSESKQTVPHFYLNVECELDKLLSSREELNAALAKENIKLSVNDFVIKACAQALKLVPAANASWTDEAILQYNNVDISVAVAIEGGLITPIIRQADTKTLSIISNEMKDLAARAKSNKLNAHEFQGGGFSISNLGMFGIKNFNAIINPPQACILAVGAGSKRVIVKNEQMVIATVMDATLSVDHRVVDGAIGAEFLSVFKKMIENPILLLA